MLRPHSHQQANLSQQARTIPLTILKSELLTLSADELDAALQRELDENPALERIDEASDPIPPPAGDDLWSVGSHRGDVFESRGFNRTDDDSAPDWQEIAGAEDDVLAHLEAQLLPSLPTRLRPVGEYYLGSLDARGYLQTTVEDAANDMGVSWEDASLVLERLHDCEPAGVGARSLRECLLLQLRHPESLHEQMARQILEAHFDDFVARRVKSLCRKLGALPKVIESACDLITSLTPFPLDLDRRSAVEAGAIREDLIIERTDAGWHVRTLGIEPECLHISRAYEERLQSTQGGTLDRSERQHIEQSVSRAHQFIEALRHRRQVLLRIGAFLVERHSGFLATGDQRFLNPHPKAVLAQALGVHESTISRATKGKFVRIATGETVPFSVFFKPASKVQRMIAEILSTENPASPLSDQQVANLLAERGVRVARRTVNKYRDAARLLSSRRRRTA